MEHGSHIRGTLTTLVSPQLIRARAARLGVVKRRRKVDVVALVYAIVLGGGLGARRTLSSLRGAYEVTTGITLAPSAFYDRFTTELAELMRELTEHSLAKLASSSTRLKRALPRGAPGGRGRRFFAHGAAVSHIPRPGSRLREMMLGTTMTRSSVREALKGVPLVMLAFSCNSERTTMKPLASAAAARPSAPAPAVRTAPKIQLVGAGIDRVLLAPRGQDAVRLEKRDGRWMVVSPAPVAPADSSTVDTLFADLDRTAFVAPVRDAPEDGPYLHIVAERGETSVFDAWIGGLPSPRRQLYRAEGSSEVWVVRNIAPWIMFASAKDFRARKRP